MSADTGELNVKIDVDMSSFNNSIDKVYDRLQKLKSSINSVNNSVLTPKVTFGAITRAADSLKNETIKLSSSNDDSKKSTFSLTDGYDINKTLDVTNTISLSSMGINEDSTEQIARAEANSVIKKEVALLSI